MAASEKLQFLITANVGDAVKGFEKVGASADKNLSKAEQRTDKLANNLIGFGTKAIAVAGVATIGLAKLGQSAAEQADQVSRAGEVFGEASGQVEDFGAAASRTAGISKTAALDAASFFGTFGKSAGLADEELATFSTTLVQAAGDLSSFTGIPVQQALDAIGSGLAGESEPLKRFGIFLNDAALKAEYLALTGEKVTGVLTGQQKVLAANSLILKQLGDAQGDFVRTSDSAVNQQKTATAEFANAAASLGQAVLPAMSKLAGFAADAAGGLLKLNESTGGLVGNLLVFGVAGTAAVGALSTIGGAAIKLRGTLTDNTKVIGRLVTSLGGLGVVGAAAGGVAAVAAVHYALVGREKAKLQKITDDYTAALQAEASGQGDALEAVIARQLADSKALDLADQLGISTQDLAKAIRGQEIPALREAAAVSEEVNAARLSGDAALERLRGTYGDNAREALNLVNALSPLTEGYERATRAQEIIKTTTAAVTTETQAATVATFEYAAAQEASAEITSEIADATNEVAEAYKRQTDAANEALNATLGLFNAELSQRDAARDTASAMNELALATEVAKQDTDEGREAAAGLAAQQDDAIDSALRLAAENARLAESQGKISEGAEGASESAKIQADTLRALATNAIPPVREELLRMATQLDDLAGTVARPTVDLNDGGTEARIENIRRRLIELNGATARLTINVGVTGGGAQQFVSGRSDLDFETQAGGPIPGAKGEPAFGIAHGGEFVLSADVVDAIKKGGKTAGLGALGGFSGGGNGNGGAMSIGVVNVYGVQDVRGFLAELAKYRRQGGRVPV
jgi:hypothetical protein